MNEEDERSSTAKDSDVIEEQPGAAAAAAAADVDEPDEPHDTKSTRKHSKSKLTKRQRRRSDTLPGYIPCNLRPQKVYHCSCGCGCSEKDTWPVHKRRSKCAGVIGAVFSATLESESENELEEKMERFETQKQKYEFRVHHGFEEEGYRLGPR